MSDGWDLSREEGFLGWYDETVREASRYARRLCHGDIERARDLVQEGYLAVLSRARSGALHAAGAGLIVTAIRTRFIDQVRRADAEDRRLRLVASSPPTGTPSTSAPDVTEGLSERSRVALVLRYVDGLSVAEIAGALGLSVHATESVISRAKAQIRRGARHG